MENRDKRIAAAALLLCAGGVIGAGIALLFAPQTGRKTRKDLVRYIKNARNCVDETVDTFSSNVHGMVEAIGEKTDELLEKTGGAAGGTRKDLLKLIEEGVAKLEKFKKILGAL